MLSSSSTPTPTPTTTTTGDNDNNTSTSSNHNTTLKLTNNRLIKSSPSSSSSSYASSNPAPPTSKKNSASDSAATKTMEEVWKDINLASLNEQNTRPTISTPFGGIMFQDFLARPFTINDPTNATSSSSYSSASEGGGGGGGSSLYCAPSPTPHPLTALSLGGSRPEFQFDHHHNHHNLRPNGVQLQHNHNGSSKGYFSTNPTSTFDTLPCSSSLPCFGSKRFPEPADPNPTGDRRNKRMIKNRESAARSRARKQAYTNELQLKVDHLLEENARLKKQQQQLCEAVASQQKKRSNLYRTSTAPF